VLIEALPTSYTQLLQRHRQAYTINAALATSTRAGWVNLRSGHHYESLFGQRSPIYIIVKLEVLYRVSFKGFSNHHI